MSMVQYYRERDRQPLLTGEEFSSSKSGNLAISPGLSDLVPAIRGEVRFGPFAG